jgi:sec-independent protein translocase protein TatC
MGGVRRAQARERRMSIGGHLVELRKRLFISAIAVLIGVVVGFLLSEFLIVVMSAPVRAIEEDQGRAFLNFANVTSAFDLRMKIALTVGIVIASPVWLHQVWAYLVPALTRKEIGVAAGFVGAALPLFLLGCFAGWYVLPHIVVLMLGFTPEAAGNFLDAATYYDFVLKLTIAVGVAFVLPVFLVLLNAVGVLAATSIIRGWRWAILVIVIFTAFATPAADVVSMVVLAVPMIALYFAAYGVAYLHDRRAAKRRLRESTALPVVEASS